MRDYYVNELEVALTAKLKPLIAAKDAQIARLTQERDWQYEANASLIAKAGTEAYETARAKDEQIAALRAALTEAELRLKQAYVPNMPVFVRIRAALEMSGGVL